MAQPLRAQAFCHFQGPMDDCESLFFIWDICISFWETAKHLGEAVWVEMTTKLKGMLKESSNHSIRIYWASVMFQELCKTCGGNGFCLGKQFPHPAPEDQASTLQIHSTNLFYFCEIRFCLSSGWHGNLCKGLTLNWTTNSLWVRKSHQSILHSSVKLITNSSPCLLSLLEEGEGNVK